MEAQKFSALLDSLVRSFAGGKNVSDIIIRQCLDRTGRDIIRFDVVVRNDENGDRLYRTEFPITD